MRILAIEHTKLTRIFLKGTLSPFYIIDFSTDGEDGSYLARTNEYNLIILDTEVPKKEGLTVCQEIRAAGKTVPILVLSALHKHTVKTECAFLNAGADDYLCKPFTVLGLLAHVKVLLRRIQPIADDVLHIDDLTLDTSRHLATRRGRAIDLTIKQFMLLEYLMRNQGIVLSRAMILEHVWDRSIDLFSNTVDAHIVSLRRKIDAKAKRKLIHTVRGMGYRIM